MGIVDDIQTKMTEAADAVEAGDLSTALAKARGAWALFAAVPDGEQAFESVTWDRRAVERFIADLRKDGAVGPVPDGVESGRAIRFTPIRHTRPSS